MNYAVYLLLTVTGCFLSLMVFCALLSLVSDMIFDEREDENELPKL